VNDHFLVADLMNDQIATNGQSPKSGLARRLSDKRRIRDSRRRRLNSIDKTGSSRPIVSGNIGKYLIEIGECAALISELQGLRWRANTCSTSSSVARARRAARFSIIFHSSSVRFSLARDCSISRTNRASLSWSSGGQSSTRSKISLT
jgi:hypothetical protein